MPTILITGAAGFIGYHLCKRLLEKGYRIVGIDNVNDYYDVELKYARLTTLGIDQKRGSIFNDIVISSKYNENFSFVRMNLEDRINLPLLFERFSFLSVCNLAAQAGVRYSLENPMAYVDSNLVGFVNLLECCRHSNVKNLVYASSSSVYGLNSKIPFSENDRVDQPISLYAATKRANELIAFTYSHLYGISTSGLRFFTVYGPWGRPDMAPMLFAKAILEGKSIKVFNDGEMSRDFTFIDDVTKGIEAAIVYTSKVASFVDSGESSSFSRVYNIGNSKPVELRDFIKEIELFLGISAQKEYLPLQSGDVVNTWADITKLKDEIGYSPSTTLHDGVEKFITWFKRYYGK